MEKFNRIKPRIDNVETKEKFPVETMYHGTARVHEGDFDLSKSNTAPAVFLSKNKGFADEFGVKRTWEEDGELKHGVTYKVEAKVGNVFDSKDKENLNLLKPIISKLIEVGYKYENSGIDFDYKPTRMIRVSDGEFKTAENATFEEKVSEVMWRLENGSWRVLETPPVIDFLKSKGYDSFCVTELGVENYAIFNTENIEFVSYVNSGGEEFDVKK